MPSPFSPVAVGDATPKRSKPKSTKTRAHAQRRVYGKRKVDAPRAVFDERSPAKLIEKKTTEAVQDAVDCIQAKLAEVRIDETQATQQEEATVEKTIKKAGEARNTEDEHGSNIETQHIEPENGPHSAKPTPKKNPVTKKRYETMVEVRISPKIDTRKSKREQRDCQSTDENGKRTTRNKPAQHLSSSFASDDKANAYVRTILDEALSPTAAHSVQQFSSWAAHAGNLLEVVKLAEGSYGEVYKLRLREEVCKKEMSKAKLARLKTYGDGVFKVVPLRAQSGPGSKKFTSIQEIVTEVKMLKYLDPIPGFARFREIHVVKGRFPESFQKAWDYYKKTKDDCLNPNPSSKRAYPDSQLWAIVEMDDAGCELEKFSWSSIFQIYDIFWGVAMALARAEEYAFFEHRDLHLGNVCIRSTRPDGRMDPPTDVEVMRLLSPSGFGISTLETTIIDYSLSRAELRTSGEFTESVDIASSDLDKKQIFDAIGRDEDEFMLRNTYR
ncbi:hypothetical protein EYZ11_007652 [Aspergillus tanneri]|nr:hypothetical protein EYZ11_007652 [Aspergillus tanneri]